MLLALPSAFKGSEVRRWQIFLFLSLGWMILSPVDLDSNLALPLLEAKKVRGASFITPPLHKFYSFSPPPWQCFLDVCEWHSQYLGFKEGAREWQSFLRSSEGHSVPRSLDVIKNKTRRGMGDHFHFQSFQTRHSDSVQVQLAYSTSLNFFKWANSQWIRLN